MARIRILMVLVLAPVARLVSSSSTIPGTINLQAAAEMRNETQF